MTTNLLKASTAVIALAVASPAFADGSWTSIEGGLSSMQSGYSGYMYPVTYNGGYGIGLAGNTAIEHGFHIGDGPYSVSFGVRTSVDAEGYAAPGYYGGIDGYASGAATATLDFEVGRDISLGGVADGRVTLGVRAAAVASGDVFADDSYYGQYGNAQSGVFVGAGPRIAVEASIPVSGNLSIDVEAGAALLFGSSTSTAAYGYNFNYSGSYTQSTTVTDLDFSAAVSYMIGSKAKVSLGYRIEQFSGLAMYGANGYTDVIIDQGAFLKFTTSF